MPKTAYVGIDVACAKKKRLPLAVCVHPVGRLETMPCEIGPQGPHLARAI